MKKQYLPLMLAVALCQSVSGQSRFDADAQIYVNHYQNFVREPGAELAKINSLPFTLDPQSRGEVTAEVLAILNEGTTAEDLENYGLEVKAVIGSVAVCSGALDDIIALADTDLTLQISFPKPVKALLDQARATSATGINDVHAGTGLSKAYTGKGIVAGIYDIGMDPNHVNFLGSDGESRIKNLWFYSNGGKVTHYDTPEGVMSFTTDDRAETHGTHTMGCLAGSYKGNGDFYTMSGLGLTANPSLNRNQPIPYYGVAPEAEIAAACGVNTTTNIVLACQQLASYIKSSGKPGLISLSFGSNQGPHDNTDPATMALNTIAKEIPFFVAAGNEGDKDFTLTGTFGKGVNCAKTFVRPDRSSAEGKVEIWSGHSSNPLTIKVIIYDRTAKKEIYTYTIPLGAAETIANSSYSTPTYIRPEEMDLAFTRSTIQVSHVQSQANKRYQAVIQYNLSLASGNTSQRYALGVSVEGADGMHYDLVHTTGNTSGLNTATITGWDIPGWSDGTPDMSISDLACGPQMICVGSWNTRIRWANLNGNAYSYGGSAKLNKVSTFSSYGTLASGRSLPMVCAPGCGINSSISSYHYSATGMTKADVSASTSVNGKTHYYMLSQGTSMATPIAAGICALWLQANPNLTPADVRYIIQNTSVAMTDDDKPVAWGAGKINALEGLKLAIKIGSGVSDV
ncbi:MAG: S8 family serine peptidase, partial [Muribaculaceae bacterium]|nr:S8 family serine peptidase [Muribaculaceae bacterium]